MRSFSSCGKQGLLSCSRAWALDIQVSVAGAHRFSSPEAGHVGPSQTRDRTCVPCSDKQVLLLCAREVHASEALDAPPKVTYLRTKGDFSLLLGHETPVFQSFRQIIFNTNVE